MSATQPEEAIASNETLQPVVVGLERKCLKREELEIAELEIAELEIAELEIAELDIEVIAINKTDRWSIYHRLQELEIPCNCAIEQPLGVRIATPTSALQLWSIARRYRASRHQLLDFLEDCWQAQS